MDRMASCSKSLVVATVVVASVLSGVYVVGQTNTVPSLLLDRLQKAKADGKTLLEAGIRWESDGPRTLEQLIDQFSIVRVSVGSVASSVFSSDELAIYTWLPLASWEPLSKRPVRAPLCESRLPTGLLNDQHGAVRLVGGTLVLDGIRVVLSSPDSDIRLQPKSRYLLIGHLCDNRTLSLGIGRQGIFSEDSHGRLQPIQAEGRVPWQSELLSLGTVSKLRERLRKAPDANDQ